MKNGIAKCQLLFIHPLVPVKNPRQRTEELHIAAIEESISTPHEGLLTMSHHTEANLNSDFGHHPNR